MLPDRVSNSGALTYESGALPIALRGLAKYLVSIVSVAVAFMCTLDLLFTHGLLSSLVVMQ